MSGLFGNGTSKSELFGRRRPDLSSVIKRPEHAGTGDEDSRMRLQVDLFEHARDGALKKGAREPNAADLATMEAHARAMARQTARTKYDPDTNREHKFREEEQARRLRDRDDTVDQLQWAGVKELDRAEDAARDRLAEPRPSANPLILLAAVATLAGSAFGPFEDGVFASLDDGLRWLLSGATAWLVGELITRSIMAMTSTGERAAVAKGGLIAGALFGVALGLLRFGAAQSALEVIVALALCCLEFGTVYIVELTARDLSADTTEWARRKAIADESSAGHEVASDKVKKLKGRLADLDQEIEAHLSFVEERNASFHGAAALEESAVKAVHDGWRAGVSEVVGRLRGTGGGRS